MSGTLEIFKQDQRHLNSYERVNLSNINVSVYHACENMLAPLIIEVTHAKIERPCWLTDKGLLHPDARTA